MSIIKIAAVNLKHNFPVHFIAAVLVALLTLVVFGISALDARAAAQPLEMLLPFIGAILFTPVFLPEQDAAIRDAIRSKKTDYLFVCFIRVLYSAAAVMLITAFFVLAMKRCESAVTVSHFVGSCASSFFLGAIGLAFAGLSGSVSAGYMAAVVYYIANIGLKDELGVCYLFSMCGGKAFTTKYWLLVLSILCVAGVFPILRIKEEGFRH